MKIAKGIPHWCTVLALACIQAAVLPFAGSAVASPKAAVRMQDFAGFWRADPKVKEFLPLGGGSPPLNAKAKQLYLAYQAAAARGDRWFDTEEDCLPLGITRLVAESPFELVVDKDRVALLFEWNRLVHFAPRALVHPNKQYDYPNYDGHTIAHMNGNRLVLDSVYFTSDTILDYSGLPHSGQLHVVQSLAFESGHHDHVIDTIRITDPRAFTAPWKTQLILTRMPSDTVLPEDVCVDRKNLIYMHAHQRRNAGLKALGLGDL